MPVPVQVDVQAAAELLRHASAGRADEPVPIVPDRFCFLVAGARFDNLPIAINLPPGDPADDDVRPMSRLSVDLLCDRAGQLLRADIERKRPLVAIRNSLRLLPASMDLELPSKLTQQRFHEQRHGG